MPTERSTPNALLRCLNMLADEASSLQLTDTRAALLQAMEACRAEAAMRPGSSALH